MSSSKFYLGKLHQWRHLVAPTARGRSDFNDLLRLKCLWCTCLWPCWRHIRFKLVKFHECNKVHRTAKRPRDFVSLYFIILSTLQQTGCFCSNHNLTTAGWGSTCGTLRPLTHTKPILASSVQFGSFCSGLKVLTDGGNVTLTGGRKGKHVHETTSPHRHQRMHLNLNRNKHRKCCFS